jgi:flagellar biosynthesis protein FlhB
MILIREGIAMLASILVVAIAYTVFGPLIDQVLAGYVMDALADPGTTALSINGTSLLLTNNIILMGIKVFSWFVVFAIFARFFLYVGFKTEEAPGVY